MKYIGLSIIKKPSRKINPTPGVIKMEWEELEIPLETKMETLSQIGELLSNTTKRES
jgi:hypothetical protein